MFEGLFENLRFQRLLAQEPMKFANLVLQSPIIRSRHDLFPTAGRSRAALRHQPTPGEQLVWGEWFDNGRESLRKITGQWRPSNHGHAEGLNRGTEARCYVRVVDIEMHDVEVFGSCALGEGR